MSQPVISVENLSKSYLIGHQGPRERYTSLRDTISKHARNFARRTIDTFAGKQMLQGDSVEEFWALKDVSFEVQQGEVLGIIGRNGAGKSTLLKVLSRITAPTHGRVTLRGRVASLLEVGTGFHPELSGRENIFLNGAILGMSRREINSKFDEIVDFAGVEKFLDTPVKRYSSGMYVRLAFAVAAHLEPEILVVDEVLAVGDTEFQKKCMGKMQEVAGQGRTVLFVSHSMAAISSLCPRVIVMENGSPKFDGATDAGLDCYLRESTTNSKAEFTPTKLNDEFWIINMRLVNQSSEITSNYRTSDPVSFHFQCDSRTVPRGLVLSLRITSAKGVIILTAETPIKNETISPFSIIYRLPGMFLAPGQYSCNVALHVPNVRIYDLYEDSLRFTIEETGSGMESYAGVDCGVIIAPSGWKI